MTKKWANISTTLIIFHQVLNSCSKTRIETKQRKRHNEGSSWQTLGHDRSGSSGNHERGSVLSFWGFTFIQTYKPDNKIIEKGENLLSKQVWLQGSRAQSSTKVKGEWILLSAIKIHKPVTLCALCHFPPSILCSCVYFVLCPYQILDYTVIYHRITGSRPAEEQEWPRAGIHGYLGVVRSTGPWKVLLSNVSRDWAFSGTSFIALPGKLISRT